MSVLGYSRSRRSYVGLRARAMALALVSARYPQPSRMMRTRGLGRGIISLLAPGYWLLASGFWLLASETKSTAEAPRHREKSVKEESIGEMRRFQTSEAL